MTEPVRLDFFVFSALVIAPVYAAQPRSAIQFIHFS